MMLSMVLALAAAPPAIAERAVQVVNQVCIPFSGVDADLQAARNNAGALGLASGGMVAGNHVFTSADIQVRLMESGGRRFCYVDLVTTRELGRADLATLDKFAETRRLRRVPQDGQVRWENTFLILAAAIDEGEDGNPYVGITMINK